MWGATVCKEGGGKTLWRTIASAVRVVLNAALIELPQIDTCERENYVRELNWIGQTTARTCPKYT